MENILQWGIDLIRLIQSQASPAMTKFMMSITWLGAPTAYLILIPYIYWCIDEKKGFRLGLAVLISAWLNITLKFLFDQPRPFFSAYDPSLQMIPETMGGLPSGHAQNVLVMGIIIASWIKRKWAYISAAIICLMVGFSRIYLGVHFPSDILAGWIVGAAVLCVYFLAGKKIEELMNKGGYRVQMITIAAIAFIMILYRPDENFIMSGALLLGLGAGYILNRHRYVKFSAYLERNGKRTARYLVLSVRFLLGITVTALIYVLFRKITPIVHDSSFFLIVYFIRYALIGLWVGIGAPWLFCILNLTENQTEKRIEKRAKNS